MKAKIRRVIETLKRKKEEENEEKQVRRFQFGERKIRR
jgi:hypothetical protein